MRTRTPPGRSRLRRRRRHTPGVDAGTPLAEAGTRDGATDAGATDAGATDDAGLANDGHTSNDAGPPENVPSADAPSSAGCTTTAEAGAVQGLLLCAVLGVLAGRGRR